jgi:hypothetical protein
MAVGLGDERIRVVHPGVQERLDVAECGVEPLPKVVGESRESSAVALRVHTGQRMN